jgi:hypothetical protein
MFRYDLPVLGQSCCFKAADLPVSVHLYLTASHTGKGAFSRRTSPPFIVPLTTLPKLPSPSTHSEPSGFVQILQEATSPQPLKASIGSDVRLQQPAQTNLQVMGKPSCSRHEAASVASGNQALIQATAPQGAGVNLPARSHAALDCE